MFTVIIILTILLNLRLTPLRFPALSYYLERPLRSQSKSVEDGRRQSKTVEVNQTKVDHVRSNQLSIPPHPMSFVCRLLVCIPFLSSFPLSMTPVCHSMTPMTLGPTSHVSPALYFALASFCFASSLRNLLGIQYLSKTCSLVDPQLIPVS